MADKPLEKKEEGRSGLPAGRSAHPMLRLREEMDRLFDDFFTSVPSLLGRRAFEVEPYWPFGGAAGAAPAVDVAETETEFRITAELPGMGEDDIDVTLSGDMLTLKGEKKEEKESEEGGRHLSERRYGSFQRAFRLPDSVEPDEIQASFEKGVLTLVLPKTREARAKTRKISVKGS